MNFPLTRQTYFYSPDITGETYEDFSFQPLALTGSNFNWDARGKRRILGIINEIGNDESIVTELNINQTENLTEGWLVIRLQNFQSFQVLFSGEKLDVNSGGTTLLHFILADGFFDWDSSYRPSGALDVLPLILKIRNGGGEGFFATFDELFSAINEQARYLSRVVRTDSNSENVIIEVHGDTGELNQTIHAKSLPPVGIKIIGISDTNGNKPIINSEGVVSQFSRNTLIDSCHAISMENLILKNIDSVGQGRRGCLVVTNSSRVSIKDIDFVATGEIVTLSDATLQIGGTLRFTETDIKTIVGLQGFSSCNFSSIGDTPTGNKNIGLKFFFNSATLDKFARMTGYSMLTVGSSLIVEGGVNQINPSTKEDFCKFTSSYFT